jgi:hypothetical protein
MVVLVKAIKPSKLRDGKLRLELLNAMRKAATVVKSDFEKTVETWEKKPKFEVVISLRPEAPAILVDTEDEIYRYVNDGTRPHAIFAGIFTGKSRKRVLSFPSQFRPKTKVRQLRSFRGFKGGPNVQRPFVQHPGTEARNFDEVIKKKRSAWFKRQMEKAMRKAARKSGHAAG